MYGINKYIYIYIEFSFKSIDITLLFIIIIIIWVLKFHAIAVGSSFDLGCLLKNDFRSRLSNEK